MRPIMFTASAAAAVALFAAGVQADQTVSRDLVRKQHERTCNYYDNRARANSPISAPGEPGFLEPMLRACEIIDDRGWLEADPHAGTLREQLATHFALRGGPVMNGLGAAAMEDFRRGRKWGVSVNGYGDTALFLALRHKSLFRIANDVAHVAEGESLPREPVADPFAYGER